MKKILLALSIGFISITCSRDSEDLSKSAQPTKFSNSTQPGSSTEPSGPKKPQTVSNFIPKKIIGGNETSTDIFEYTDKNKLKKRIYSYYKSQIIFDFVYEGDLIKTIIQTNNSEKIIDNFSYDDKGRLERIESTTYHNPYGNLIKARNYFTYEYLDNKVLETNTDGIITTYILNNDGTIKSSDNEKETFEYTYDNKNSIYKNILGVEKLYLYNITFSKYNMLSSSEHNKYNNETFKLNYDIKYNESDFPIKIKYNDGVDVITTIEYDKL